MDQDAPSGRAETLLIVDDEEMLVELLRRLVERHGFKALCAMSGAEALAVFAENQNEIDLVLTDLMMPGMDGKQLAQELLAKDPNVRILISTGYSEPGDISFLLDAGARGVVMKPYQADRLIAAINSALSDATHEDMAS